MSLDILSNNDLVYNLSLQTQTNQNEENTSESLEQVSLWQLKCPCPICKVKCYEGTDRKICQTCKNWFHLSVQTSQKHPLIIFHMIKTKYLCG